MLQRITLTKFGKLWPINIIWTKLGPNFGLKEPFWEQNMAKINPNPKK